MPDQVNVLRPRPAEWAPGLPRPRKSRAAMDRRNSAPIRECYRSGTSPLYERQFERHEYRWPWWRRLIYRLLGGDEE